MLTPSEVGSKIKLAELLPLNMYPFIISLPITLGIIYNLIIHCMFPYKAKIYGSSIFNPVLKKHLIIGQRQNAPNFSVSIGQHFVTTRIVHLPKRTETSLITELDRRYHITESDQTVWAMHSCWLVDSSTVMCWTCPLSF